MASPSYINNAHPAFIEALYNDYQTDAASVDADWRKFFEGFDFAVGSTNGNGNGHAATATNGAAVGAGNVLEELKVFHLIGAYRRKGHLEADTNPIRKRRDRGANLNIEAFGLKEADLDKPFAVGAELGLRNATLRQIIDRLRAIYCGKMGVEYVYLTDPEARNWLKEKLERRDLENGPSTEWKRRILRKLTDAVVFENFLAKKYVGQKRFGLEGGESVIPGIDAIINTACEQGVKEVVIGMAHRGRLNVLVSTLKKTYEQIFSEFEGNVPENHDMGDGDVKYHLGFEAQLETMNGKPVELKLMPNPSHLEAVDPVVQGFVRAKADAIYKSEYDALLPILIHGDAAIAGQGIVYEIVQMSKLEGYDIGGTIHIVINNQIGFTTDFDDARTADYCTSVAYMVKAPVIHVNGDDVEEVVFAAQLAAEYRQRFNTDIFIDMVCYRKHGHNEGDDPRYTQPGMYDIIKKHRDPRAIYVEKLQSRGDITQARADEINKEFWDQLQARFDKVKQQPLPYKLQENEEEWVALRPSVMEDFHYSPDTSIDPVQAKHIIDSMTTLPEDFNAIRKFKKQLDRGRTNMLDNNTIDWAGAELLAYGSILMEGRNIRMSGQDVKRGTFSHRHAVVMDEKKFTEYNRLSRLSETQGEFMIYNSLLSEYAVLGFEYGYSVASPKHLAIWEAQFGDFANGAQIMIDQFITSSESKWGRMSGMMMLLPHGYAGQGPEHSSARLERFLQACGEKNICVANITTPANLFHAIRRQLNRPFRKPLVIMSPKSLLRHPECVSSLEEMTNLGSCFRELIDDTHVKNKKKVRKVIMCSGKLYYELNKKRIEEDIKDVAIVRIEQLYPLPRKQFDDLLAQYPKKVQLTWVQEEPANMGALWHLQFRFRDVPFDFVARKTSASPATGYKSQHDKEQADILNRAFA